MNFTPNQQLAIDLKNRNILVSAAAGSGKTATLTERIIQLITNPFSHADIGRMLIVTFTRAAAGELRTRISKKLSEALSLDPGNYNLAKQLTALGGAKICTIDSYYLELVRTNFQRLNLPARFRLADETELKILRYEIMNSVIERLYDTDKEFVEFADEITSAKGETKLAEILLDLEYKISASPEGISCLSRYAERYIHDGNLDYFNTSIGMKMKSDLIEEIRYLGRKADRLIHLIDLHSNALPYAKAVGSDKDHIETLIQALKNASYSTVRNIVFDYSPAKLGNIKADNKDEITEEIKSTRNEIKERLCELKDREFSAIPGDMYNICLSSARLCRKLREVLNEYLAAYADEKSQRAVCEFSDLRKYALELLIDQNGYPTQLAFEEQKKFDHIFVDEYQDTDYIQDLVFQTISNGQNLFFVGDIKQSIYSFRGAEPSVFSSYRKAYQPLSEYDNLTTPASVFMSENFRCSPNIIDFTNSVCSYLFRETEGNGHGIGYVAEDDLISSRAEPISKDKVKIVLLEENKDTDREFTSECSFVISEIRKLLNTSKPDGKNYMPRDIAILTRSNKEAAIFADALAKAGISHANSTGSDLFENPEVLLMLCILSVADNPRRDIPLAGALRSPIFGFSLSDLVKIRHGKLEMALYDALNEYANDTENDDKLRLKCINTIKKIDEYRTEGESLPVHLFIRYLWHDTNALSYAGADKSTENRTVIERRRNLRRFYEYARKYEASSFKGLHDFVEYVNGIISQGTRISSEDAVTENTIQIMTIHKSKGLEFSTVFLVGCNKAPSEQDSRKQIVFSKANDLGIAFKISDASGYGQIDTPHRITIGKQISELSSEEEIRILYVALTRARDSLYIIASGNEGFVENRLISAERRASLAGRYSVLDSGRYIDRILTALAADKTTTSYSIELPHIQQASIVSTDVSAQIGTDPQIVEKICDELSKSINFVYPHKHLSTVPAKVSVSKLYPELLNESEDNEDMIIKAKNLEPRTPRFMGSGDDAAEKGTATHLFMQFCDFGRLAPNEMSVNVEISRLVTDRYITQDIADLIRVEEVVNFVKTDIFVQIRDAKEVYREFRFNIFLPASQFTTSPEQKEKLADDEILVQGVIDICFVNQKDELVLCDYKTDRLSREARNDRKKAAAELFERHGEQLSYYSSAIKSIMGKEPDKIYIYSLAFGDALEAP